MTIEEAIKYTEVVAKAKEREAKENRKHGGWAYDDKATKCFACATEHRQLAEWLKELVERRKQPEIIYCKDCVYYDQPHVENKGTRYEYAELPEDAFDELGTGLVNCGYGINIGGRCTRDYHAGYSDDKRVFVSENNFCGRAERRTDDRQGVN